MSAAAVVPAAVVPAAVVPAAVDVPDGDADADDDGEVVCLGPPLTLFEDAGAFGGSLVAAELLAEELVEGEGDGELEGDGEGDDDGEGEGDEEGEADGEDVAVPDEGSASHVPAEAAFAAGRLARCPAHPESGNSRSAR